MVYASGNDEAVAGFGFELSAGVLEYDAAADDVDHLLVGVAVLGAYPALFLEMTDEHHGRAVGHDLALEAGLRCGHGFVVVFGNFDWIGGHSSSVVLAISYRGLIAGRDCSAG